MGTARERGRSGGREHLSRPMYVVATWTLVAGGHVCSRGCADDGDVRGP